MSKKTHTAITPGVDLVEPLAPIRRLVLAALCCAAIGVVLLIVSAVHVMESTNADALARERMRANAIADAIAGDTLETAQVRLKELAAIAGLGDVQIADAGPIDATRQSIPLFSGALRGKVLSWEPNYPGKMLFEKFAPSRVPLLAATIIGVLVCLLLTQRHVRRIAIERRRAQRQARNDHLTGLANRLALEEHLQRLTKSAEPFSVLAMDLDSFKPINDMFGHDTGDRVLREIAQRLNEQMRDGDVLARVGGDEFVAIVHRNGGREALATLAQDLIATVRAPLKSTDGVINVDISIGIVPDGSLVPSGTALKLADRALYDAKRSSAGAFCFSGDDAPKKFAPKPQTRPARRRIG